MIDGVSTKETTATWELSAYTTTCHRRSIDVNRHVKTRFGIRHQGNALRLYMSRIYKSRR